MRDDVDLVLAEQRAAGSKDTTIPRDQAVEGGHGRIETRAPPVINEVAWLRRRHAWPGLNAIIVIDSLRETRGTIERETRLYITSLTLPAHSLGPIVRTHRAVGNSLHRGIDVVLRDDKCRLRTDNPPANVTPLKHIALEPHPKGARTSTRSVSDKRSPHGTTTSSKPLRTQ